MIAKHFPEFHLDFLKSYLAFLHEKVRGELGGLFVFLPVRFLSKNGSVTVPLLH